MVAIHVEIFIHGDNPYSFFCPLIQTEKEKLKIWIRKVQDSNKQTLFPAIFKMFLTVDDVSQDLD